MYYYVIEASRMGETHPLVVDDVEKYGITCVALGEVEKAKKVGVSKCPPF